MNTIIVGGKKRNTGKENVPCSNDFNNKLLQSTFGKLVNKSGVTLSTGKNQNQISMLFKNVA